MSKKVLSNEEFWDLVDQYESYRKGNVRDAIDIIVDAYTYHKSNDVDQALADYQLLTRGKKISKFVRNQITTQLGGK